IPRFSRISWKSRDDAEPPRMPSRSDAAKRRRSVRAIPGAPTQTWYCSVSLRWKRTLDVARRGQDDVAGRVRAAVVGRDRPPPDRRDHLGGADHGTAERVLAEH